MAGGAAPHGAIPAETDPPDSVGGASTPLPASLLPIPLEPASTPPHTGAGPTTPAGGAAGEGRRREKGDEQSKEGNGTPGERARHLAPYEYSGQTHHELLLLGGSRLLVLGRFPDGWLQVASPEGGQVLVHGAFFQRLRPAAKTAVDGGGGQPSLESPADAVGRESDATAGASGHGAAQTNLPDDAATTPCTSSDVTPAPSPAATPRSLLSTPRSSSLVPSIASTPPQPDSSPCLPEKTRLFTDKDSLKQKLHSEKERSEQPPQVDSRSGLRQLANPFADQDTTDEESSEETEETPSSTPAPLSCVHTSEAVLVKGFVQAAATLLQARARGMSTRRYVAELKKEAEHGALHAQREHHAAVRIQARARGMHARARRAKSKFGSGDAGAGAGDAYGFADGGGGIGLPMVMEEEEVSEGEMEKEQSEGAGEWKIALVPDDSMTGNQAVELEAVAQDSFPDGMEYVDLMLDVRMPKGAKKEQFKREVQKDVAHALGIAASSAHVLDVRAAGVLVALQIDMVAAEQQDGALNSLLDQLYDADSDFKCGIHTRHTTGFFIGMKQGRDANHNLRLNDASSGSDSEEECEDRAATETSTETEDSSHEVDERFAKLERKQTEREREQQQARERKRRAEGSHRSLASTKPQTSPQSALNGADSKLLSPLTGVEALVTPLTREEHIVMTQRRVIGEFHAENAALRKAQQLLAEERQRSVAAAAVLQQQIVQLAAQNKTLQAELTTMSEELNERCDESRQALDAERRTLVQCKLVEAECQEEIVKLHRLAVSAEEQRDFLEEAHRKQQQQQQQCILDLEQQHQQQQQELVETRSKVAILQKVAKLLCTSVNVLNQDLETELGLQATIASAAEEQRSANAMELEEQAERLTEVMQQAGEREAELQHVIMGQELQLSQLRAALEQADEHAEQLERRTARDKEAMVSEHATQVAQMEQEIQRLEVDLQRTSINKEKAQKNLREALLKLDVMYERAERQEEELCALEHGKLDQQDVEEVTDGAHIKRGKDGGDREGEASAEEMEPKQEETSLYSSFSSDLRGLKREIMRRQGRALDEVESEGGKDAAQNRNLRGSVENKVAMCKTFEAKCYSRLLHAYLKFVAATSCNKPVLRRCLLARESLCRFAALLSTTRLRSCLRRWAECVGSSRRQRTTKCNRILNLLCPEMSLFHKRIVADAFSTWLATVGCSMKHRIPRLLTGVDSQATSLPSTNVPSLSSVSPSAIHAPRLEEGSLVSSPDWRGEGGSEEAGESVVRGESPHPLLAEQTSEPASGRKPAAELRYDDRSGWDAACAEPEEEEVKGEGKEESTEEVVVEIKSVRSVGLHAPQQQSDGGSRDAACAEPGEEEAKGVRKEESMEEEIESVQSLPEDASMQHGGHQECAGEEHAIDPCSAHSETSCPVEHGQDKVGQVAAGGVGETEAHEGGVGGGGEQTLDEGGEKVEDGEEEDEGGDVSGLGNSLASVAECVDQLNTDIARLDAVSLRATVVSRRFPAGSYGAHKVELTSRSTDAMSSTGGNRAVAENAASGRTEVATLTTESRRVSDVNLRGSKGTGFKGGGERGTSGRGGGAGLTSSANRHHIRRLLDML